MPAGVSGWTATFILTDTATSLLPTAARDFTTPTASATCTTPRPTLKPRVPTSTAVTSTVVATIILPHVTIIGTMGSVITRGAIILGVIVSK